eukprot:g365.t1
MEKIKIGMEMATYWTDPTMVLIMGQIVGLLFLVASSIVLATQFAQPLLGVLPFTIFFVWWNFIYHASEPADTTKYVIFHDKNLESQYAKKKMPMSLFYESFIEGKCEFNGDAFEILDQHRYKFLNHKVTLRLVGWLYAQIFPNQFNSSMKDKKSTKKEIAEHYDRGNDFFEAFLGPSMVYTSGVFRGLDQTLEQAQFNKMSMICDKLQLKKKEKMLDIGCGWGTLVRHAAKYYGAQTVGVTLSEEGAKWCKMKNKEEKLTKKVDIVTCDYRDIPERGYYDKISSIEMAEHVGLANFQIYLSNIRRMLKDDGLFLMQVAGLRQSSNWEDVAWGLFMSKYIFPGADASTPCNWYIKQLEMAGFEIHSVETIGRHYGHTLHKWYDNWMENKDAMKDKYGNRLFRMWEFFLSWSAVTAGQGTATCYQILVNKNINKFPRDIWCEADGVSYGPEVGVGIGKDTKAMTK